MKGRQLNTESHAAFFWEYSVRMFQQFLASILKVTQLGDLQGWSLSNVSVQEDRGACVELVN